jgi:chemotaxis receptor (MCP) glutamine deamidase CheD
MTRVKNISHQGSVQDKEHRQSSNPVRIFTGDVATSSVPTVLHTLLGSCVAVCLYDPILRAGGMNHIMLPGTRQNRYGTRFGVHAMELLINELMKLGGERRRFIAKAFGGACVVPGLKSSPIGDDNATFVRMFLQRENIPLVAQRLGGCQAVHVYFRTDTGKVFLHSVDGSELPKIIHAENSYRRVHLADRHYSGEITLF